MATVLPNYTIRSALADPELAPLNRQNLANIGYLLKPPTDYREQDTQTAQYAFRAGLSGSEAADAAKFKLRESERIARMQAGHQMLEPYLARAQTISLASISEDGANYRAVLAGENAMKQLQLQEQGLAERQTAAIQADLMKQAVSGKQAMEELIAKGKQDEMLALMKADSDKQMQILAGAQALQRMQFEQAGLTERSNAEIASALQRQILAGEQELEQIKAQGENTLANTALAGKNAYDTALLEANAGLQRQIMASEANLAATRMANPLVTPGQEAAVNYALNRYAVGANRGYQPTEYPSSQEPIRPTPSRTVSSDGAYYTQPASIPWQQQTLTTGESVSDWLNTTLNPEDVSYGYTGQSAYNPEFYPDFGSDVNATLIGEYGF